MPASVSLPSWVMWLSHMSLKEETGEVLGEKRKCMGTLIKKERDRLTNIDTCTHTDK